MASRRRQRKVRRDDADLWEIGSASQVAVQIDMSAGKLNVRGGADSLAEASFRYDVAAWHPGVAYTLNGNQGILQVTQSGEEIPVGGELVNEWDLRLSDAVPLELSIGTGAGEADLDLRGLDLSDLQIEMGAGQVIIDLSSILDHDLSATVNGGLGDLLVMLPAEMGVRVTVDSGLARPNHSGLVKEGDHYVNEAFGIAPHTLSLNIGARLGAVELLTQ